MSAAYIHPTAEVEPGALIGPGTRVWHLAHIRAGAVIGADCVIGRGVYIDTNVRLGDRCKVQNYVSVYDGCTLEDEVFLGPHVVTTNDLYPRAVGDWTKTPTIFKRGCSIGANSVIVCGTFIGAYAMIGSGSVVTHRIRAYTLAYGNPARQRAYICRCGRLRRPSREPRAYCPVCQMQVGGDDSLQFEVPS